MITITNEVLDDLGLTEDELACIERGDGYQFCVKLRERYRGVGLVRAVEIWRSLRSALGYETTVENVQS